MFWWIYVAWSDVEYAESAIIGGGWEGKKSRFGATFYFAKKSESLFGGIGTCIGGNSQMVLWEIRR